MPIIQDSRYNEPFRGLPAELRSQIWGLASTYSDGITIIIWHHDAHSRKLSTVQPRLLNVLLACKEAYSVASRALYENLFILEGSSEAAVEFLNSLPVQHRDHLSRLWYRFPRRRVRLEDNDPHDGTASRCTALSPDNQRSWTDAHGLDGLLSFLVDRMSLASLTLSIAGMGHSFMSRWYLAACQALLEGKVQELVLAFPKKQSQSTLDELLTVHASPLLNYLYTSFGKLVGDSTCREVLEGYGRYTRELMDHRAMLRTYSAADTFDVRDQVMQFLIEHRRLLPFEVSIVRPGLNGAGHMLILRGCCLSKAKERIHALEQNGFQDPFHDLDMLGSVSIPNFAERLARARDGLEAYERRLNGMLSDKEPASTSNARHVPAHGVPLAKAMGAHDWERPQILGIGISV